MAITPVDSHGTSITFSTGFFAKVLDVSYTGLERTAIDVTNMDSTNAKEFIPAALYDAGGLEVTMLYDGAEDPPIDQAAETVTIDWAGSNGKGTLSFSGFMTNFEIIAPESGDKITAKATL